MTREIIFAADRELFVWGASSTEVSYDTERMSVAPVKKRGRPKKAVSESISAENIEPLKNGSHQKSTEN